MEATGRSSVGNVKLKHVRQFSTRRPLAEAVRELGVRGTVLFRWRDQVVVDTNTSFGEAGVCELAQELPWVQREPRRQHVSSPLLTGGQVEIERRSRDLARERNGIVQVASSIPSVDVSLPRPPRRCS